MNFNLKESILVIYIFTAIFAPPILPFNILYILFGIASLFCVVRQKKIRVSKSNQNVVNLLFIFLLYVLIVVLLNELMDVTELLTSNRIIVIYQTYVLMPMQFIVGFFIVDQINLKKRNEIDFIRCVIYAGLIEAGLVVISFIIPSVRDVFLQSIMIHGGTARAYGDDAVLLYRGYGWADTLLDTFGYGMGILSGVCLLYEKLGKIRYFWMTLFLFSTIINSRTGIAIFMIAVLIWAIKNVRSKRATDIFKPILYFFIFLILAYVIISLGIIDKSTVDWVMTGFTSIWNFITGTEVAYSVGSMQNSLLSSRFWVLPDSLLGLLLGRGHSLFGTRQILGYNSDVGYINYIWICGVLGLGLLIWLCLKWFKNSITSATNGAMKNVRIFLCFAFFLMFIKGNVISHTAGTFLTILICIYKKTYQNGVADNDIG